MSDFSSASTASEDSNEVDDESSDHNNEAKQHSVAVAAARYVRAFVPPPVHWLRRYSWLALRSDLLAAVTVTVTLIPQSVAYAQLAGLNARFGFQSAGVAPIVYAMLGTSHVTAIGPLALISVLSANAVTKLGLDPTLQQAAYERASIALACLSGILMLAFGLLRLGVIVRFLAHPVMAGFTTAAGLIIGATQLKHLFGVKVPDQPTVFHTIYEVGAVLGSTNIAALLVSLVSMAFLLTMRFLKQRFRDKSWLRLFPDQLVLMIGATLVSWLAALNATYALGVVGPMPQSFPLPTVPDASVMGALFVDALMIALIGFAQTIGVAATFARGSEFPIDASQEFVALGVAEIAASFFSAFAVTGGLSRTAVAAAAGAATPLHGLFVGVLAILSGFVAELLFHLPQAVLASGIIVSSISLVDTATLRHLWRVDKRDFLLMLLTVAITLGLGVQNGLLVSVGISAALVVLQASRAHVARLGLVAGTGDTFRNVRRFSNATEQRGVVILRYDAPLFFANAQHFEDTVVDQMRRSRDDGNDVRAVLFDFAAVNTIDSTAMRVLWALVARLEKDGVRVMFAQVKGPVRDSFRRFGIACSDAARFQLTLQSALQRLKEHGFCQLNSSQSDSVCCSACPSDSMTFFTAAIMPSAFRPARAPSASASSTEWPARACRTASTAPTRFDVLQWHRIGAADASLSTAAHRSTSADENEPTDTPTPS
jgi:SulP family sulfate permease